ncbi:MAG TPA: DUF1569 domain-containing protein [Leptospiraceae bacterium]|nr:DUF1569 domain-containing protein [Leptospiraceae bacterium]HMY65811.1 DUF1569 domain-containing protein [Leptospiraceae bacterium]HMZ59242.1 DUF1569 domain-containing protein [Leptospiraceae bacterium]HNF13340.1 DUF1569 domain-containing protein [Leptospiraceae bacterium]HNF22832.1 DUF1569 domain-containing protein [Leptospiraceae bacterium]
MKKRDLRFKHFSDAKQEIMNLKGKRIKTAGNWNFYQILCHLADGLEFMLHGGSANFIFPAFLQMTAGKLIWNFMLLQGKMLPGLPNPVKKIPEAEGDSEKEFERILSLIEEYELYTEEFFPHPVFGKLTKEEWGTLQAFHFANHLSYVSI